MSTEQIEVYNNIPIKKLTFNLVNDGSCQCFKDCDCYANKGKIEDTYEMYANTLYTKRYTTLKNCKQAIDQKLKLINQ
jgi:hypothetical protein